MIATNLGEHDPLTSEGIDQLIETLQHGTGESPRDPIFVVFVKGGMVEETLSNIAGHVCVVDQDTDGADEQRIVDLPHGGRAGVTMWYSTPNPDKVEEYAKLARQSVEQD